MDYTKFLAAIDDELAAATKSGRASLLRFQNHFYGCVSVMEMLASGELGGLVDISSVDFSNIGVEFGFYDNPASAFTGGGETYRSAWQWGWENLSGNLAVVDEFEEATLAKMRSASQEPAFFVAALAAGELPADMAAAADELLAAGDSGDSGKASEASQASSQQASKPAKKSRRRTRRHGVTPIQRRRLTAYTRRKRPSIPAGTN